MTTCWAYAEEAANLRQPRQPYEQELPGLMHSPLPAFDQVLHVMQRIVQQLRAYDGM